eukprot:scaffold51125_cov32-Tisochrysis_lutea.AAC.1
MGRDAAHAVLSHAADAGVDTRQCAAVAHSEDEVSRLVEVVTLVAQDSVDAPVNKVAVRAAEHPLERNLRALHHLRPRPKLQVGVFAAAGNPLEEAGVDFKHRRRSGQRSARSARRDGEGSGALEQLAPAGRKRSTTRRQRQRKHTQEAWQHAHEKEWTGEGERRREGGREGEKERGMEARRLVGRESRAASSFLRIRY